MNGSMNIKFIGYVDYVVSDSKEHCAYIHSYRCEYLKPYIAHETAVRYNPNN